MTIILTGVTTVDPMEFVEDFYQFIRRNPNPLIRNGHDDPESFESASSDMVAPSGEYLIALSMRLNKISSVRSRSARPMAR